MNKIELLQARVDTLEDDRTALQEKAGELQEKNKALTKEKKCNVSSFGLVVVAFSL